MGKDKDAVIDLLNEVIDKFTNEINDNDFEPVYDWLLHTAFNMIGVDRKYVACSVVSEFTELLYSNGIDPLKYLKTVPPYFAIFANNVQTVTIGSNIDCICGDTFGSKLNKVIFTTTNRNIDIVNIAFRNCVNLKEIVCPKWLKPYLITHSIFDGMNGEPLNASLKWTFTD